MSKSSFQETPIGTKIVRNAAFGVLRIFLIMPIPLLLTPFIIRRIGTQGLGIWSVFTAINNLTSLADFGVLGTLTRHVSEHFARKDYVQLNRTLNSGLVMFFAIGLLCAGGVILASGKIVSIFFPLAPVSSIQLQHAVSWLGLAIGFNLLAFPFVSITTGLQRLGFTNLLSALNFAANAILAASFLASGTGIMGLAYAIVLSAATNLILQIIVARYLLPEFLPSISFVHIPDIKSLWSFSLKMYVTQIAVAVHTHTEKFLLAHFSGLTAAGWYDVANDLATKMRSLPSLLLTPLLPAITELETRQEGSKQRELYYRTHKYLAFTVVPMAVLVGVVAQRFVELWLGPGFSATATALAVLASVHLLNLTCAPAALVLIGKGNLKPGVRSALYGIFSNLIVSTFLVIRLGFNGALYGTAFSVLTATAYLIFMFHRETRYPIRWLLTPYLKPFACSAVLGLSAKYLFLAREVGWAGLIVTSSCFLLAYGLGLVLLRYFDAFDLQALERIAPLPRILRRIVLFADTPAA